MEGDQLYPPLNAPPGQQAIPGVQPGVSNAVVVAQVLIVFGPRGGIFIYSPTPGPGNLVGSWAAAAGTDLFGNPYTKGLTIGSPSSSSPQVRLIPSAGGPGSQAAIEFTLSPTSFFSNQPNIQGLSPGSIGELIISGPALAQAGFTDFVQHVYSTYSAVPATMQANYRDISGTFHTYMSLSCSGTTIQAGSIVAVTPGTGSPAVPATPETWHPISLAAGWSTLGGFPVPSYRLLPDGNVQVAGLATHAAFGANIALSGAPVSAAYTPLTSQFIAAAEPGAAGLLVDPSGNWTATTGVATGTVSFTGAYPVNL